MKLVRFGPKGEEKPGIIDQEGKLRDLSSVIADVDASTLDENNLNALRDVDLRSLPIVEGDVRYGACVNGVGKFLCIGLNYKDHAEETGAEIPAEPVVFSKFVSAIGGANDDVVIPKNGKKVDWEIELGVVIGKNVAYVNEDEAEEAIAGYCVINDISERAFQLEKTGQWDLGKGCDTFGPLGPWLVTKDEIPNVLNLKLWLDVNGERRQTGNTELMIFSPAYIVSYLSQFMSLQAGDVISTGTPPGVGLGFKPPIYLKEGDTMHLGIEGLGEQNQKVIAIK